MSFSQATASYRPLVLAAWITGVSAAVVLSLPFQEWVFHRALGADQAAMSNRFYAGFRKICRSEERGDELRACIEMYDWLSEEFRPIARYPMLPLPWGYGLRESPRLNELVKTFREEFGAMGRRGARIRDILWWVGYGSLSVFAFTLLLLGAARTDWWKKEDQRATTRHDHDGQYG
jgi:hypothetical protein